MPVQITVVSTADPLRVRIAGAIDADDSARLSGEIQRLVQGRQAPRVIIDLTALDGATIIARRSLVAMQAQLKAVAARTAYLCSSPLMRGLGLSVGHLAEDEGVKAVMNEEQAAAWLSSTEGRFARADRILSGGGR
jgi:anti-anti-sigma regulatory factor